MGYRWFSLNNIASQMVLRNHAGLNFLGKCLAFGLDSNTYFYFFKTLLFDCHYAESSCYHSLFRMYILQLVMAFFFREEETNSHKSTLQPVNCVEV